MGNGIPIGMCPSCIARIICSGSKPGGGGGGSLPSAIACAISGGSCPSGPKGMGGMNPGGKGGIPPVFGMGPMMLSVECWNLQLDPRVQ